jgi:hypothetical protein
MVPSDPSSSLSPNRHARSRHGIRGCRDVLPLTPRRRFYPAADRCARRVRVSIPIEVCVPMRPFTRQQRVPALRPASAAGLTLPAYIFDCPSTISQNPFGSALPATLGFLCLAWRVHRASPVALSDSRVLRLTLRRHSPPGSLDPSGS